MNQYVLVIEDDSNWQKIFDEIVEDAGFLPRVVSTYSEAMAALAEQNFVLAIVDVSLIEQDHADRGGVNVLREIDHRVASLPAIVVTGYATVDLAIETLAELNAVHFFRKDNFDRREFTRVLSTAALPNQTPAIRQSLSEREQEVLNLLIEGRTNKQIAEELTITVNTVKKHVQSIFTKFNVDNRAAAVARALGGK